MELKLKLKLQKRSASEGCMVYRCDQSVTDSISSFSYSLNCIHNRINTLCFASACGDARPGVFV